MSSLSPELNGVFRISEIGWDNPPYALLSSTVPFPPTPCPRIPIRTSPLKSSAVTPLTHRGLGRSRNRILCIFAFSLASRVNNFTENQLIKFRAV